MHVHRHGVLPDESCNERDLGAMEQPPVASRDSRPLILAAERTRDFPGSCSGHPPGRAQASATPP